MHTDGPPDAPRSDSTSRLATVWRALPEAFVFLLGLLVWLPIAAVNAAAASTVDEPARRAHRPPLEHV